MTTRCTTGKPRLCRRHNLRPRRDPIATLLWEIDNMHPGWTACAAVLGMIAVGAGAFGAHGLQGRVPPEDLDIFEVGVRYQMYHALALLAVAWMVGHRPSAVATASAILMVVGTMIFSGTLYGIVLIGWRWLGAITPIGGTALMIGWFLLAIAALKGQGAASF